LLELDPPSGSEADEEEGILISPKTSPLPPLSPPPPGGGNLRTRSKYSIQDSHMLAGLETVRDTERSKHTAIRPAVPFPLPHPTFAETWKPIRVLRISVPQMRSIFVLPKPRFFGFIFKTYKKSGKRHQKEALLSSSL